MEAGAQHKRKRLLQAFHLAKRAQGRSWPNPAVGCIVENESGTIISSGWTAHGGRPHAEATALHGLPPHARPDRLYVTLEPCSHFGKSPPCTDAILHHPIRQVVIALQDPNPHVNGMGISKLKKAGLKLEIYECPEINDFYLGYRLFHTQKRPRFTLKMALSADGRSHPPLAHDRESRIISGPTSHQYVHALRSRFDAIMIGTNTLWTDDPRLTCRLPLAIQHQTRVIILDRNLKALTAFLQSDRFQAFKQKQHKTIYICHDETVSFPQPRIPADRPEIISIPLPVHDKELDLSSLAKSLGKLGFMEILVEGGGTLAAGLLNAGLLDRCLMFNSPRLLGSEGHFALGPLQANVQNRWSNYETRNLGEDQLVCLRSCLAG